MHMYIFFFNSVGKICIFLVHEDACIVSAFVRALVYSFHKLIRSQYIFINIIFASCIVLRLWGNCTAIDKINYKLLQSRKRAADLLKHRPIGPELFYFINRGNIFVLFYLDWKLLRIFSGNKKYINKPLKYFPMDKS